MGQQQPQCVIIDKCPGIKKACPNVFKHSMHKYCMWHIIQKMPEKVGTAICNDTEFMTDVNAVVWDVDLEPEEFEQNWETVIEAHGMQSNRWLKYVFAIRQKWIPAYFRDLPLGCLLRTTQRSECSNSYFKRFESHFGNLVEFWMRYNSAIEQQRHSQRRMDTASEHSMLEKVGPMKVEMHASLVYAHPIFADFQNEVKHAICNMGVGGLTTVGTVEYHDVRDDLRHRNFRVEFNTKTNESKCACKLFERHGIVCRHILWVWNGRQVIEDIDEADIKKAEMSKVWSEIYAAVGVMDSYTTVKQMKQLQKTLTQQLKENKNRNYTEADMDNQFIAGVNALKKYYTEVYPSISTDWTPVLKAIELMEGYKNPFQDESVEVESTVQGPARRRQRIE
ncbi:protein FAR1-RELATED SEQUENCE 5-like [Silene latifolia]|uniref:protein FAR1-RELATED SEQUENCE 5-like n=1 Tax=Silene latifolia TaxID=37657 RepID=UPI003D789204